MKRTHDKRVHLDPTDLSLAKSIASLHGITMKDYLGRKIKEDALTLPEQFLQSIKFDTPKKGRRGNIALDILVMIVCMSVLAIILVIAYPPLKTALTGISSTTNLTTTGEAILTSTRDTFPSIYDAGFAFLFMGIWIFFLASAYFIENHPIFFVVNLVVMILALLAVPIIGNVTEATIASSTEASSFPYIQWMTGHYLELVLLVFFTVTIAYFARNKERGIIQ